MGNISSVGGVQEEIARRLNQVSAEQADIYLNWINLCTKDVCSDFYNAPFLVTSTVRTLSSGTREYALPSDFDRMRDVVYPGGDIKLTYVTDDQFDALQPSASESGTPAIYTIHGSYGSSASIEYYPSPTAIDVTLRYFTLPPVVSATSAALPLPNKYTDLYCLYGEYMGLRQRANYNEASNIQKQYQILKERMKIDLINRTEEAQRIKDIREMQRGSMNSGNEISNLFWGNV